MVGRILTLNVDPDLWLLTHFTLTLNAAVPSPLLISYKLSKIDKKE